MATDQWLSTVPTGQCFSKWLALAGLLSVNLADPITIFLEFFSSRQNFFFSLFHFTIFRNYEIGLFTIFEVLL